MCSPVESNDKCSPIESDDSEWSDASDSDSDEECDEIFGNEELETFENLSQAKIHIVNDVQSTNIVSELDKSRQNILQFIFKLYSYGDINRKIISTIINDELHSRIDYLDK